MIRLIYGNKAFKIINQFNIKQSNNEITFNDITIDFTGYTLADMPLKYQECKIKECEEGQNILTEGNVLFFGYVDTIELSQMKMSTENRELSITLLSPLKLATVRTATINGTYNFEDAMEIIFEPLVNDGFTIAEINVSNTQITLSYIMQSIESIMNDISLRKNIFWWIDENKNIYINSMDYLFGKNIVKELVDTKKEKGFIEIEPSIEAVDYANVINIKNARLIYKSSSVYEQSVINYDGFPIIQLPKNIKEGDTITFENPVIISESIAKKVCDEIENNNITLFRVDIGSNTYSVNYNNGVISKSNEITYSNDEGTEGTIVLQRDNFFDYLITGFKYNGSDSSIIKIESYTTLRYIKVRFLYSKEIEKLKGIISNSGQIEKTIDANEKWFTLNELTEYARSLIIQNKNIINSVVLEYDEYQELKIGDLVKVNLPNFYTTDVYAVKEIEYNYVSELEQNWKIKLQNSELLSSYIDIFRPVSTQETETQNASLVISEFIEEEVKEIHELYTPEEVEA